MSVSQSHLEHAQRKEAAAIKSLRRIQVESSELYEALYKISRLDDDVRSGIMARSTKLKKAVAIAKKAIKGE